MLTKMLIAGTAVALLAAGAATAGPQAKSKASAAVASPQQPIPYNQLEAYRKASPQQRATRDWSSEAATGAATDTAATAPASREAAPADAMNRDPGMAVNPPAGETPAPMPSTPPVSPPPPEQMIPDPGSNLPGGETLPTEPK